MQVAFTCVKVRQEYIFFTFIIFYPIQDRTTTQHSGLVNEFFLTEETVISTNYEDM